MKDSLSDNRIRIELERSVIESAKLWRSNIIDSINFPHSEAISDLLSSSCYALESSINELNAFEEHQERYS